MSIDSSQYRPGDIINGHQLSADGTEWVPVGEPSGAEEPRRNWFARHKVLTGIGAVLGAVILFAAVSGGEEGAPADADARQPVVAAGPAGEPAPPAADPAEEEVAEEAVAEPAEEPVAASPDITTAQANALRSAEDYLAFTAFSEQGLIDQLSSEYGDQFAVEDAVWAVAQLDVDWNAQALRSAEDYLAFTAFSEQGLIDQLSSEYGDQYTVEQASWAVAQLDVDWNEQAVRSAEDYLEFSGFSRQGLIDQLSSPYGSQFTVEQATHAADALGL